VIVKRALEHVASESILRLIFQCLALCLKRLANDTEAARLFGIDREERSATWKFLLDHNNLAEWRIEKGDEFVSGSHVQLGRSQPRGAGRARRALHERTMEHAQFHRQRTRTLFTQLRIILHLIMISRCCSILDATATDVTATAPSTKRRSMSFSHPNDITRANMGPSEG
jgi:hypothetical protein